MSPLSESQTEKIAPRSIYKKNNASYGLTEANLSDISSKQVYLVKNLTALETIEGFNTHLQHKYRERRPSIYGKDQVPYYNPVHNIKNMYKNNKNFMYSVPIDMWRNGTLAFDDLKAEKERKKSYKHDARDYYDPLYNPFRVAKDNLNETLYKAARKLAGPKAVPLDDYVKNQQKINENVDYLLGKPINIDFSPRDMALQTAMKKEENERLGEQERLDAKVNFKPNKNGDFDGSKIKRSLKLSHKKKKHLKKSKI